MTDVMCDPPAINGSSDSALADVDVSSASAEAVAADTPAVDVSIQEQQSSSDEAATAVVSDDGCDADSSSSERTATPPLHRKRSVNRALFAPDALPQSNGGYQEAKRPRMAAQKALEFMEFDPRRLAANGADEDDDEDDDDTAFSADTDTDSDDVDGDDDADDGDDSTAQSDNAAAMYRRALVVDEKSDSDSDVSAADSSSSEDKRVKRRMAQQDLDDICVSSGDEARYQDDDAIDAFAAASASSAVRLATMTTAPAFFLPPPPTLPSPAAKKQQQHHQKTPPVKRSAALLTPPLELVSVPKPTPAVVSDSAVKPKPKPKVRDDAAVAAVVPAPAVALPHSPAAAAKPNWVQKLRTLAGHSRQNMRPELERALHLLELFNVQVRRATATQLFRTARRGSDAPFVELSFDMRDDSSTHVVSLGAMGMYENMLLKIDMRFAEDDAYQCNTECVAHIHLCDKQFDKVLGYALVNSRLLHELSICGLTWADLLLALFGLAIVNDDGSRTDPARKQLLRQSLADDAHGPGALMRELIDKWMRAPTQKNKKTAVLP